MVKGDGPPAPGLWLERNGGGKRGAVFSPRKGEEPGQSRTVRVSGAFVRHKLLPNFIGPGHEQDLQGLADQFVRFPLEQRDTDGLRCNDEAGLVKRHGARTQFKLRRGVTSWLAGSRPSELGLRFSHGRHGSTGTLVLA